MTATSSTTRSWAKPAFIGAAVLAIAGIGFATFGKQQQAPDVTFISIDGQKISSQDLRGKVVMVNFWATSCTTCVKEMPQMIETYNKFKGQGLEFVAVAMNYDRPDYVLNYTQAKQLPFKVALDSGGDLAKQFGDVNMTPTTFVIDKDGKILKRYLGEPDFGQLHTLLQKSLSTT
ncbi:TlpA disulfide reductase family protein [Massilia sp. YIM B02763]|uniref:TlpA disulfide reductase family protein n=1 Tax=Massilia sp. YIM B02763 TaxID=3050130 RepID=UPI0025B66A85|nr:TlpA disulfide reductase family protein [Massilia sp. YIM B02763]MDN4055389.1 TlpA disulfide reductase family protein [Massilia sp. YIM B02763]